MDNSQNIVFVLALSVNKCRLASTEEGSCYYIVEFFFLCWEVVEAEYSSLPWYSHLKSEYYFRISTDQMVNIYDPNNTEPHRVSQTFTDKENLFKCDKSEAVSSNISSLKKWILTIIYIVSTMIFHTFHVGSIFYVRYQE